MQPLGPGRGSLQPPHETALTPGGLNYPVSPSPLSAASPLQSVPAEPGAGLNAGVVCQLYGAGRSGSRAAGYRRTDPVRGDIDRLVFPDPHDAPPSFVERLVVAAVTGDVEVEL